MIIWFLKRLRCSLSMDLKWKPTSGKTDKKLKWNLNKSDIQDWEDDRAGEALAMHKEDGNSAPWTRVRAGPVWQTNYLKSQYSGDRERTAKTRWLTGLSSSEFK